MANLEYSALMALARALEGREILTPTRQNPFRIEVMSDVGLKFFPASGKPRPEYRSTIEVVLGRYGSTGSTRKSDYNDDSHNASYLLALIRHYRDENPARTTISAAKVEHDLQRTIEDSTRLTEAELADRVTQYPTTPAKISVVTTIFQRNPFVVRTVLKNANGVCQSCFNDAPF